MKIHYEDNLEFQQQAIDSVVKLFSGQEINRSEYIGSNFGNYGYLPLGITESQLGIGNKLELENDEILKNIRAVQLQNGLPLSEDLSTKDFTVEMETGTGKTYVYLRTIFELHRLYGFVKFAIIVPSIAIKEGTFKTLEITREHFENLYPESKGYEYYLYDSLRLGKVRNFATNSNIQIMIVTVGAINKQGTNNLYKENETTSGEKPIDFVRAANPILIVDEPQSVDGGLDGKGRSAMEMMNPLCTLRYSATHVHKHHMVYRLDAVEAYERQLVKQIEVASLDIEGGHNKPFVKLISTHNDRGTLLAKVQAEFLRKDGLSRQIVSVEDGDDLEKETGRDIYRDFRIGTITKNKKIQKIALGYPGGEVILQQDDEFNGVNPIELKRLMIRRTIKEHLDKELRFKMRNLDVKVLSLFFIDSVEYYRKYDAQGNIVKGKYAVMFEEEFRNLTMQPEYRILFSGFNPDTDIEQIHNGYFSIDKKGGWTETDENNKVNRENAQRAYNLIMKEKERLLSFDTKLKFIFSHSALKEGWDNPNVFQICALREMGTERERRQTIGRGMRLCVNQKGKRLFGFDINTLTVIASESFETFAERLQSEIVEDSGIRFGVVDRLEFASVLTQTDDGVDCPLGAEDSTKIWKFLHSEGYVNMHGEVLDKLRNSLEADKLDLPEQFKMIADQIKTKLRKLTGKIKLRNSNERVKIQTNDIVYDSPEFQELWDRIKYKTIYRVHFDNEKFVGDCVKAIDTARPISKTRARFRVAKIDVNKVGLSTDLKLVSDFTTVNDNDILIPDLLTELQEKTGLTRKSLAKILLKSTRLNDCKKNPQLFLHLVSEAINRTKQLTLVDGIKYQLMGKDSFYAQELFKKEELLGYFANTIESRKSIYKRVVLDSESIEKVFAVELETNESVKVYAKLPSWFKIPTPLGSYNPDWALVVEDQGVKRVYFVVETKFSEWVDDLRTKEGIKISCGESHFEAIESVENPAKFVHVKTLNSVLSHVE